MLASAIAFTFCTVLAAQDEDASSPTTATKETLTGVPIGTGQKLAEVNLTSPLGGWSVTRMLQVSGTVSDVTVDPITLSINGDRYLLRTNNGHFSRAFPAASGKNVVTAMATNKAGTASTQVTTYVQAPAVPLKVILTSDTDGVYTDLHIYEPTDDSVKDNVIDTTKMQHVYWARTQSPSGGTFFLNEQSDSFDQPGYGPYLYIHRAPPRGVYAITTNYWPSGDKAHTQANLNLIVNESTPKELRRTVKIPLAAPGTTRVLAWVMITQAGASVYVPSADLPPAKGAKGWPSNLEAATKAFNSAGGDGGGYDE